MWLLFSMVMSTSGEGLGLGSGSDVEAIDEKIHELVMSEITRSMLDATPVMFGTIKEGVMELLDEHLGAFRVEISVGQLGDRTQACTSLEFFGKEDPIASSCIAGSKGGI